MANEQNKKPGLKLAGLAEAAAFIGVTKPAVCERRKKIYLPGDKLPPFPAPLAQLDCGPIWEEEEIKNYVFDAKYLASLSSFERRYPEIDPADLLRTDLPAGHPFLEEE